MTANPPPPERADDPQDLKTRFEAIGVAVRAGINPEAAADRLGMSGLRFTGAMPSLRLPETEADALESR